MNPRTQLQGFASHRLPLILSLYFLLQPLLDILTALGVGAGHSITAGVAVRTLFMALGLLYVLLISRFDNKKWCLLVLWALVAYLALFSAWMFRLGGLSLCLSNVKELVKTFYAPFVLIFLYAVYREYGRLLSTRTMAVTGGLYAGVILAAFLTNSSNVSYGNSGYGYNGWFYAANETSSIIAIIAPIAIYYCLTQLPTVTRKTWWKGLLIAVALLAIAFSANFIGTKIVFATTLVYCLAAFVWLLTQHIRLRHRDTAIQTLVMGALCLLIFSMYAASPLQSYFNNIYMDLIHEDPELVIASWGEEIQKASEDTWLRELINNNEFVKRLDQILSRRLLSASPSIQVFSEGGLPVKLLGIGYTNAASYSRSVEFMIEMDPLAILIRHGVLGFLIYVIPYLAAIAYLVIRFFQHLSWRLSSLEYCSYLYSTLIAFAIALIAGHVLVSPAVSIFMLATGLTLWTLTQRPSPDDLLPASGE